MDILKFAQEHQEIIITAGGFILGLFFTKIKANLLGQKIASKLPKKACIQLADYLDAFEQGLRNKYVNGNKDIITNEQLSKETEKLKNQFGFRQEIKGKNFSLTIDPLNYKKKLIEFKIYRKADSILDLFKF